MLRLLDILLQLDHLKNAKASIPNDFSWYKRYVNLYKQVRKSLTSNYSYFICLKSNLEVQGILDDKFAWYYSGPSLKSASIGQILNKCARN